MSDDKRVLHTMQWVEKHNLFHLCQQRIMDRMAENEPHFHLTVATMNLFLVGTDYILHPASVSLIKCTPKGTTDW